MTWMEVVHQGRERDTMGQVFPGFRACRACGALMVWERDSMKHWAWRTPVLGHLHTCEGVSRNGHTPAPVP